MIVGFFVFETSDFDLGLKASKIDWDFLDGDTLANTSPPDFLRPEKIIMTSELN